MSENDISQALTPDQQDAAPAKPVNPDLRWYVVHAYSGMEKAVERNIRERINRAGMQDMFGEILVPTEEVVEIKNGQKRTSERRFYPGYVLVQMVMPGDNVSITVTLIAPIAMEEGLRFAIREGGKTVGAGVVAKIME